MKVIVSARVEQSLSAQIDQLAADTGKTRGDIINMALEHFATFGGAAKPAAVTAVDKVQFGFLRDQVKRIMSDGQWHFLEDMAFTLGLRAEELAGLHRRMRELRETRHGAYTVDKRKVSDKRWQYRLAIDSR